MEQNLQFILTPYRRNITEDLDIAGERVEPLFNYTPYQLFCLRSQLLPYLHELLGYETDFQFVSIETPAGMQVTLSPVTGMQRLSISADQKRKIQLEAERILNDHPHFVLIFDYRKPIFDRFGQQIPRHWIRTMTPYLTIPVNLYPFERQGTILGYLAHLPNYNSYIDVVSTMIADELRMRYRRGYIVGAQQISAIYNLEVISNDGMLYRPKLVDESLPNIVPVLEAALISYLSLPTSIHQAALERPSFRELPAPTGISAKLYINLFSQERVAA